MRTLKIINIFVILLIFTPFFNSCSNGEFVTESAGTFGCFYDVFNYIGAWFKNSFDEHAVYGFSILFSLVNSVFAFFKNKNEIITQATWKDVGEIMSYIIPILFVTLSFLLNGLTLANLFRKKTKHIFRLYLTNTIFLLVAFISANLMNDIHISQIKWGFYLYWIGVIVLCIKSKSYTFPSSTIHA